MANTGTITLSSTGTSNSFEIDLQRVRNGVGLLATVSNGGDVSYTLQLSIDNTNWNNHDTMVSQTASANGSLLFPIRFLRLTGTINSGSVTLGICQAS